MSIKQLGKIEKLKPCPFCGGEAVLYHQSSKYTDKDGNYVHCIKCGARTKLFECFNGTGKTHTDTKKEAVEAWQKRADNASEYLKTIEELKMEIAGMEAAIKMISKTIRKGNKDYENS